LPLRPKTICNNNKRKIDFSVEERRAEQSREELRKTWWGAAMECKRTRTLTTATEFEPGTLRKGERRREDERADE